MRMIAGLLALIASAGLAVADDGRESRSQKSDFTRGMDASAEAPASSNERKSGSGTLECLREAVSIDGTEVHREAGRGRAEVTFPVSNRLPWAIAGVYMKLEVKTEGRSVPWEERIVALPISGGVEPGETRELAIDVFIPPGALDPLVAQLELDDVIDQDKKPLTGKATVMGWSDLLSERTCDPQALVALLPPPAPEDVASADMLTGPGNPADASPLTAADKIGLQKAVQRCWNVPAGLRGAPELRISVAASLLPDGDVLQGSIRLLEPHPAPDGRFEALFRAARSALIRCGPYPLPPEKHARWQSIEMVFNPEGMVSW